MQQHDTCSGCGVSLPGEDAGRGACPRCLIGLALADESDPSASGSPHGLDPLELLGERIGAYTLLDVLGEGGMGVVYLAEQTEPIQRSVALKLIKLGMNTREVLARFDSERQTLALMSHPHIARVHDAGATRDGRPYFVMELVHGVPITEYCDRERLTTVERLALFKQVCAAIQHAHTKGIIHRDIKPSNVLVARDEQLPVVKVIDFGIAKATDPDLEPGSLFTRTGALVGTPDYMSPEQAQSDGQDVDTRTDVYQLGVLLYQILVGVLPFDPEALRRGGLDEARRRIRTQEPPRPSARLDQLGDESVTVSRNRKTETRTLTHALRGDLDWIVMKALDKDRVRRYSTPGDLAADIDRHLRHEPVVAGPPGTVYRMGKFARRHRLGAAVGAFALLGMLAFTAILALQARRIAKERDRASREAEAASQVSQFLIDLFGVSDPGEARGNTISAREILDEGARRVERDLASQPEVQARMMATIGTVYERLGLYRDAAPLLEQAAALRRATLGENHPESLQSLLEIASLRVAEGDLAEGEKVLREALERSRRALGENHPQTLAALSDLGAALHYQGRLDEAEALYREALPKRERVLGADDAATLETLNNLAATLFGQGRLSEAEEYMHRALDGRRRAQGADHPDTLDSIINLCTVQMALGELQAAEPNCIEAVELGQRIRPGHSNTLVSINNLGRLLELQHRYDEAEPYYREAFEELTIALGETHQQTVWAMGNLGDLYTNQGRLDEAEDLLARAADAARRDLPAEHPVAGYTLRKYGRLLTRQGRYQKAESTLLEAEQVLRAAVGADHPQTKKAIDDLVELYESWGRPADAARWRESR